MSMTVKDVLIGVKELISTPERCTKVVNARDENGVTRSPFDPRACCWCLLGAIRKVTNDGDASEVREVLVKRIRRVSVEPYLWEEAIWMFNDHHNSTHENVLKLLDKAIASCP